MHACCLHKTVWALTDCGASSEMSATLRVHHPHGSTDTTNTSDHLTGCQQTGRNMKAHNTLPRQNCLVHRRHRNANTAVEMPNYLCA